MTPFLLSLALLGQAAAPAVPEFAAPKVIAINPASTDLWRSFSDFYPSYEFLCHWDAKSRSWPYSRFRLKASAATPPESSPVSDPIDYGVTLAPTASATSEVRGTDSALARELAETIVEAQSRAGQPCPGPGPCPRPGPKPSPQPGPLDPDAPAPPSVHPGLLVAAGVTTIFIPLLLVSGLVIAAAARAATPTPKVN